MAIALGVLAKARVDAAARYMGLPACATCAWVVLATQVIGLFLTVVALWLALAIPQETDAADTKSCEEEAVPSRILSFGAVFFAGAILNCKEFFSMPMF